MKIRHDSNGCCIQNWFHRTIGCNEYFISKLIFNLISGFLPYAIMVFLCVFFFCLFFSTFCHCEDAAQVQACDWAYVSPDYDKHFFADMLQMPQIWKKKRKEREIVRVYFTMKKTEKEKNVDKHIFSCWCQSR